MLGQEFVQNALLAGSLIGLASGLVGYFLVLRREVFAADALSHVAFTGAIAAALAGIDLRLGLLGATVAFALALAGAGRRGATDDVAIGTAFAWILGLGVLLLGLVAGGAGGGDGALAARSLFGSIFGLARPDAVIGAAIGALVAAGLLAIARPLVFASLDAAVAVTQGVRVRALGVAFLGLVGVEAAEATQAVGALLLLGLLAAPAGAAHRLTRSPYAGLAVAGGLAVASVWIGIALSYEVPALPPSSAIIGVAAAAYGLSFVRPAARAPGPPAGGGPRSGPGRSGRH